MPFGAVRHGCLVLQYVPVCGDHNAIGILGREAMGNPAGRASLGGRLTQQR